MGVTNSSVSVGLYCKHMLQLGKPWQKIKIWSCSHSLAAQMLEEKLEQRYKKDSVHYSLFHFPYIICVSHTGKSILELGGNNAIIGNSVF